MKIARQIAMTAVGAGDLALEAVRKLELKQLDVRKASLADVTEQVRGATMKVARKSYQMWEDLAARGERRTGSVRRSAVTKRAVAETKTAKSQAKAAVTSTKKAAGSTAEAAQNAVSGS